MLKKILHISLVIIVLVSISGISISTHFCGDELISAAINKDAKSCCDGSGACCQDKTIHFEIKDNFDIQVFKMNLSQYQQDLLFPLLYAYHFDEEKNEVKAFDAFNDSSPPDPLQRRLAFIQSYLL